MSVTTGLLAGFVLVAVGATAALLVLPEPAQAVVAEPESGGVLDVGAAVFDDVQHSIFAPVVSAGEPLTVEDHGRITRLDCAPGQVIVSGSSPVTVENRPVVALATSVPLWRDLAPGARGEDVAALQAELGRLGHEVASTGVFDRSTRAALTAVFREAGQSRAVSTLAMQQVLWLPEPEVRVASCEARVGGPAPGVVAVTGAGVTAMELQGGDARLAPGARVVEVDGVTAAVEPGGLVTDPDFLAHLNATVWAVGEPAPFSMAHRLVETIEVAVVPAGSLFAMDGQTGCVVGDGVPRPVRIIASQAGRTMVEVLDGPPPSQVEIAPDRALRCP